MKNIICILLLAVFGWQCKKENVKGDLDGEDYIRGRLFLYDMLTQQVNGDPLKEKQVTISYASSGDSLNYLFSTTTDKDGYFVFPSLKNGVSYRIRYEERVNNILYRASEFCSAPNENIRLIATVATSGQNGIHLTTIDSSGTVVNGVKHCFFNSPLISGYLNNQCSGNNFELNSDTYGHASKFTIPAATYYINSAVDINGVTWVAKDTLTVGSSGILFDTVRLKAANGMSFIVLDSTGARLPNASVCLFTSYALFQRDTCEGSNYTLTSSSNGTAAIYNQPQQWYYIYCAFQNTNFTWVARDSINLGSGIISKTLRLRRK